MIRLLSRHHPAANPSPPFPLCPASRQRGRGGEGLAEAQLPHIFQDGVSPFAPGGNCPAAGRPSLGSARHTQCLWRWPAPGASKPHHPVPLKPSGSVTLGDHYTFSHCESASVHLRSADCIGVVSWDTTPAKVASYRHTPLCTPNRHFSILFRHIAFDFVTISLSLNRSSHYELVHSCWTKHTTVWHGSYNR